MVMSLARQAASTSAQSLPGIVSAQSSPAVRLYRILAVLAVIILALSLRLANLPGSTEIRDGDETGYIPSGLVMFEGMPPGYKASPAATEIWFSWMTAAFETARSFGSAKAALGAEASLKTIPFVAVEHALFKLHADYGGLIRNYLVWSALLASIAAGFACWLGFIAGGKDNSLPLGLMFGGLVACLPGLVELAGTARPYSDGWCLVFIALAIAATWDGVARIVGTGIALGLVISCRIDMLLMAPIVLWPFLDRPVDGKKTIQPALAAGAIAVLTCLVVAPWILTGLFGVIRLIATIRVAGGNTIEDQSFLARFQDVFVSQGTLPLILLAAVALVIMGKRLRWHHWILVLYAALLLITPFVGYRQSFRYHGAPIIAMIAVGSLVVIWWARIVPAKLAWLMMVAVLAMPLLLSIRQISTLRNDRVDDDATAWVEAHVPRGSRVYLDPVLEVRPPLPTREAALAAWNEVGSFDAAERKFRRGLSHYSAELTEIPLAMSEENMVLDRSNFRRWLILGGGPATDRPRYDIRLVGFGPVFGVQDALKALQDEPGVYVVRSDFKAGELEPPVAEWRSPSGRKSVRIYASPQFRSQLKLIAMPPAAGSTPAQNSRLDAIEVPALTSNSAGRS